MFNSIRYDICVLGDIQVGFSQVVNRIRVRGHYRVFWVKAHRVFM